MNTIEIKELFAIHIEQYRTFLAAGTQEETLLLTPSDNEAAAFPTKDRNDSFTLGAFSNQSLVGVISFMRDGEHREKLRHKGVMFTMYVSREFRGKGIASQLLQAVIHRVKATLDIEQINLIVLSDNHQVKRLYEKFGFEKFGTEQHSIKWNNQYFAEDMMVLRLN